MTPLEYAAKIAYSSEETLLFSYKMARKFKDSPGVYCEMGVAAGAQVIAMAYGAPDKTIYAFDSFEGIPMASNRDDQMPGIKMLTDWERKALPDPGKQALITSGATSVSFDSFWEHIHSSGTNPYKIIPIMGWFENTVPQFVMLEDLFEISILRLDGDLFHSTWVCLQHLFPKVIQGGCVIIDDIQLPGCKAATDEYFELINYCPDWKYVSNIAYFYK